MVLGKFESMPKEKRCFLVNEMPNSTRPYSKIKICLFILPVIVILSVSFALSLYALLKIQTLEDEVQQLRSELENIQPGVIDNNLIDDIRKFANDDVYSDNDIENETQQPGLVNGGDDLDFDYDLNYDDDDIEDDDADDETKIDYNEFSPDLEDVTSLMGGGSLTKIGKETTRTRREVIASTYDGVPIIEESYNDMKKKNKTKTTLSQDNLRFYDNMKPIGGDGVHSPIPVHDSSYQSPAWINKHQTSQVLKHYEHLDSKHHPTPPSASVASRPSRVMHTEDKSKNSRRVAKRPQVKSASQYESTEQRRKESGIRYSSMPALRHYYLNQEQIGGPDVTIVRDDQFNTHHRRNRHRQRNNLETLDERPRSGRAKPLPAIHFSGDTSRYVVGRHTNYNGDGHLRHPDQIYVDWTPNNWVKSLGMDQHFQMHNGYLKIKENGLYLVYAQIYYLDEHDTNGFRVHKNQETLLQCTSMTHSIDRLIKGHTCYTAGVEYLNEGDELSLKDLADGRYSLFEPGKSFFGVVKLGDARVK